MKLRFLLPFLCTLTACLTQLPAQFGGAEHNLIENGNFEIADADGRPIGRTISHPNFLTQCDTVVEMMAEGDITFYRVTKHSPSSPEIGCQEIKIPEGTSSLPLAIKMRGENIIKGLEGWALPGLSVTYLFDDSEEGKAGSWEKWPVLPVGDSDWQEYEAIIPVRDNARRASISLIGNGWTGTADFTDVVVELVE